jgi:hypothetical protein
VQVGCSQFKELKEIGYGKQQAGAEHPGFLPQHGPQGKIEHHNLSFERGEVNGPDPFL